MKAMVLRENQDGHWLREEDVEELVPGRGEVVVKVEACGVCRTDLHIVEGDLLSRRKRIVPGHEIVGRIISTGEGVSTLVRGQRVGIPWLHSTCGRCEYCISGRENLCLHKEFTGYTVAGGYAELAIAKEDFVFPLPEDKDAALLAPLLCSGIIGYRALKLTAPLPGGSLGIFGFGASAHIALQIASKIGLDVTAISRGERHLELARELGATNTMKYSELRPGLFDAAIVFAPAGEVVRQALFALKPGGSVSVPAVHLDQLPAMSYEEHLFKEKRLFSVEANTRADAREFLALSERLGIRTVIETRSMKDANSALLDLKQGKIKGSVVLRSFDNQH
jgi:propanol-preferring alcohol dehydrogenase